MIDFGLGLDIAPSTQRTVVAEQVPAITETVRVVPKASQASAFVMKADSEWGWSDLRDYVVRECERRQNPQPRDPKKEAGIFKGFMSRWGDKAPAIARMAFEVHDGMWRNAPISLTRFCKASDEYFAAVIAERL